MSDDDNNEHGHKPDSPVATADPASSPVERVHPRAMIPGALPVVPQTNGDDHADLPGDHNGVDTSGPDEGGRDDSDRATGVESKDGGSSGVLGEPFQAHEHASLGGDAAAGSDAESPDRDHKHKSPIETSDDEFQSAGPSPRSASGTHELATAIADDSEPLHAVDPEPVESDAAESTIGHVSAKSTSTEGPETTTPVVGEGSGFDDATPKATASSSANSPPPASEGLIAAASAPVPGAAPPPPLPPRDSSAPPPLPPRKRTPFFWLRGRSAANSMPNPDAAGKSKRVGSSVSSADFDLLIHRLDINSEGLESRNAAEKTASLTGRKVLQENFEQVRDERTANLEINWEFWSEVVNDYAKVARTRPSELSKAIAQGFPPELRGLIWQLIASSKSSSLEEVYDSLSQADSPHEKAIKRDLSRTSFAKSADTNSLFRIIKGYSLFDPEVGYTQGMAFVVTPLLLAIPEPEAFSLLVHLMKDYDLRSLYLPDMPGLHLRLYQFDRILEDTLPDVHIHLARQGVRSSMYASQWFLTLFAYKFPLALVYRILDIVIAEGVEAILRFGVALMKKNSEVIMTLGFDELLTFVKEYIFDVYELSSTPDDKSESEAYKENDLVRDAYEVKVLPLTLRKYENEYNEIHRLERERVEEVESLRQSNGQLTLQVRRLEASLADLNTEHIQVANEMVQGKLEIARLQDESEELTSELTELREATKEGTQLADKELRDKMAGVETENETLVEEKKRLEQQLSDLERELVDTKMRFATLDDTHTQLRNRWNDLKKHIEG